MSAANQYGDIGEDDYSFLKNIRQDRLNQDSEFLKKIRAEREQREREKQQQVPALRAMEGARQKAAADLKEKMATWDRQDELAEFTAQEGAPRRRRRGYVMPSEQGPAGPITPQEHRLEQIKSRIAKPDSGDIFEDQRRQDEIDALKGEYREDLHTEALKERRWGGDPLAGQRAGSRKEREYITEPTPMQERLEEGRTKKKLKKQWEEEFTEQTHRYFDDFVNSMYGDPTMDALTGQAVTTGVYKGAELALGFLRGLNNAAAGFITPASWEVQDPMGDRVWEAFKGLTGEVKERRAMRRRLPGGMRGTDPGVTQKEHVALKAKIDALRKQMYETPRSSVAAPRRASLTKPGISRSKQAGASQQPTPMQPGELDRRAHDLQILEQRYREQALLLGGMQRNDVNALNNYLFDKLPHGTVEWLLGDPKNAGKDMWSRLGWLFRGLAVTGGAGAAVGGRGLLSAAAGEEAVLMASKEAMFGVDSFMDIPEISPWLGAAMDLFWLSPSVATEVVVPVARGFIEAGTEAARIGGQRLIAVADAADAVGGSIRESGGLRAAMRRAAEKPARMAEEAASGPMQPYRGFGGDPTALRTPEDIAARRAAQQERVQPLRDLQQQKATRPTKEQRAAQEFAERRGKVERELVEERIKFEEGSKARARERIDELAREEREGFYRAEKESAKAGRRFIEEGVEDTLAKHKDIDQRIGELEEARRKAKWEGQTEAQNPEYRKAGITRDEEIAIEIAGLEKQRLNLRPEKKAKIEGRVARRREKARIVEAEKARMQEMLDPDSPLSPKPKKRQEAPVEATKPKPAEPQAKQPKPKPTPTPDTGKKFAEPEGIAAGAATRMKPITSKEVRKNLPKTRGKVAKKEELADAFDQASGGKTQSPGIDEDQFKYTKAYRENRSEIARLNRIKNTEAKGDPARIATIDAEIDRLNKIQQDPANRTEWQHYNDQAKDLRRQKKNAQKQLQTPFANRKPKGNAPTDAALQARIAQLDVDIDETIKKRDRLIPGAVAEVGEGVGKRYRAAVDPSDMDQMAHEAAENAHAAGRLDLPTSQSLTTELEDLAENVFGVRNAKEGAMEALARWTADDTGGWSPGLKRWADDAFEAFQPARERRLTREGATAKQLVEADRAPFGGKTPIQRAGGLKNYLKEKVATFWDFTYDHLAPIERALKKAGFDFDVESAANPYKKYRAMAGHHAQRGNVYFLTGKYRSIANPSISIDTHGQADIAKVAGDAYEDLLDYFYAKQTVALRKKKIKTRTDLDVAENIIKELEAKHGGKADWKKAVGMMQESQDALVVFMRDMGYIDDGLMRYLLTEYPFYASMKRDIKIGRAGAGAGKPLHRLGGGSQLHDTLQPIEALHTHQTTLLTAVERNAMKRQLVATLENPALEGTAKVLEPVGAAPKSVAQFVEKHKDQLKAAGIDISGDATNDFMNLAAEIQALSGKHGDGFARIHVVSDGKIYSYKTTHALKRAVDGLHTEQMGPLMRALKALDESVVGKLAQKSNELLRWGNVEAPITSIPFHVRNFDRDSLNVAIRDGWGEAAETLKGHAYLKDPAAYGHQVQQIYDLFRQAGFEGLYGKGSKAAGPEQLLKMLTTNPDLARNLGYKQGLASVFYRSDLGLRFGAMVKKARDLGLRVGQPIPDSAVIDIIAAGRSVQPDFSYGGHAIQLLNKFKWPLNASHADRLNIIEKVRRAAPEDRPAIIARMATSALALETASWLSTRNDPLAGDFSDHESISWMPAYMKHGVWWYRVPFTGMLIPQFKPFYTGHAFGTGPRIMMEKIFGDNDPSQDEALLNVLEEATGIPVGVFDKDADIMAKKVASRMLPGGVIQGTGEALLTGYDAFRESYIDGAFDRDRAPSERQSFAPEIYDMLKAIGFDGISRNQLQHIVHSGLGTSAKEAELLLEQGARGFRYIADLLGVKIPGHTKARFKGAEGIAGLRSMQPKRVRSKHAKTAELLSQKNPDAKREYVKLKKEISALDVQRNEVAKTSEEDERLWRKQHALFEAYVKKWRD